MQLQQLIYFMTVADQGSFNKAAEKLFATQPNLSKAISNLESELKVNIFYRTNRGVELTEDGKKLYQYTRTIMSQMELIEGLAVKEAPASCPWRPIPSSPWGGWSASSTTATGRSQSPSSCRRNGCTGSLRW